ncbi:hypothetical protein DICSQDRAFT_64556 [Dichomitus squalens LYAD-421 SS1]|uniref:Uncharacterized protein n=1 Tax=Dichomitus squalens (strain LYAD-421) TaxID=732165 RepID=R7SXK3_DICSQ|nr:uncharacterized protein DICSQDRAFT_64556 [Dichomitus squalens LYAD-421 SS1]EJF59697.1 hypothetical protein DICSQDRAFT_64556 [Dichomitus squalens LYAD-421 SS1]
MLQLAIGVHTYDCLTDDFFALRVFLLLVFSDIPAISIIMRMKGHNALVPCQMCNIHGIRIPDSRNLIHYVPLDRSHHPDVRSYPDTVQVYDPLSLPLRSHAQILSQAREVQSALTGAEAERLAKQYGIKGLPLLSALDSLSFPASFPYDFMHLIFENVIKNLMNLWSGNYKDLDDGLENYELKSAIWEDISAASEESGLYIPYVYGLRPPNVASDKTSWTADTRSFWMQYIGPVLLKGRFAQPKYYEHYLLFVHLVRKCLQWEVSSADVQYIREGFAQWVTTYEQCVY